jgi:CubicO group peptidase (beta-lactamase class C family)
MNIIDAFLSTATEKGEVPGVVAVATTADQTLYSGAFGTRDLSTAAPMTTDTVFWIASMTKALVSAAAMQLVERGVLSLDQDAGEVVPELADCQVLEGFDADGGARLRPARGPITVRHLLTHTAGFTYDFLHADTGRYMKAAGLPPRGSGRRASLETPLAFDPGERWEYGIGIDWLGLVIEAASGRSLDAYLREHVTGPLGMASTDFTLTPERRARLARMHARRAGALEPINFENTPSPEFFSGGGGLYGTAPDYAAFIRAMLGGGGGVLSPETVALMAQNHVGDLPAGIMEPALPHLSNSVDLFPGSVCRWGLGFLINTEPVPNGRAAGSLSWAGLANTYYWIDLERGVGGVMMMQILPFGDERALELLRGFERGVYSML